jgi:hypothetical protein
MYPNTLRLTVKHDESEPTLALLPIVGAVNTHRYERPSQLVFVENGVSIAASENLGGLVAPGWPSSAELLDALSTANMLVLGCADCARAHGIGEPESPIRQLEWVPSEDIRLPLHECGKSRPTGRLHLIQAQQAEQRDFDSLVGDVTIGADRG